MSIFDHTNNHFVNEGTVQLQDMQNEPSARKKLTEEDEILKANKTASPIKENGSKIQE